MTGAVHTLDPIAAAEADIQGSKSLMAAVANDLSQHERWLAHYRLAERRHARRLLLLELIYRLELARRRLVRSAKRLGLASLRLARSVADFLSRTAIAFVSASRRIVVACIAWLRPRIYALLRTLWRWLTAAWAWISMTSAALTRAATITATTASAWNNVLAGAALILLSLPRGPVGERYGLWQRFIR